jgi:glycerophosphoryl diester phosphodiesterase
VDFENKKPFFIAHRGGGDLAPENTIEACRLALQQGAKALEIDVRICADDVAVLFHDRYLVRHFGKMKALSKTPLQELRSLEFNRRPYSVPGKICTLHEFFEEFRGTVPINIDVKPGWIGLKLALEIIKTIDDFKLRQQVWVSSFSPQFLRIIKTIKPNLKVGYLFRIFRPVYQWVDLFIKCEAWHPHHSIISDRFVDLTRRLNKEVFVWTVNDEALLQRLMPYKFEGIITDQLYQCKS